MRITRYLPNFITCLNLLCGSLAIVYSFNFEFNIALLLILGAALFDFMDGLAARSLNVYSVIGVELDSLADIVSFGVAPAMISFNFCRYIDLFLPVAAIIKFIPLIVIPFSALRLAKFNVEQADKDSFIGLATPASSLVLASLVTLLSNWANIYAIDNYNFAYYLVMSRTLVIIFALILSALLVSEIPMFSLKMKKASKGKNQIVYIFFVLVAIEALIISFKGIHYSFIIFSAILTYIIINVISAIIARKSANKEIVKE